MTKTKDMPSMRLARVLRIIVGSVALLMTCAFGYSVFMVAYVSAGSIRTMPDPALQSTAEYLYEHPQPTLQAVEIIPQPTPDNGSLCYIKNDLQQGRQAFFEANRWTELYLNGQRVPPSAILDMAWMPSFSYSCVKVSGPLNPGLHLFELHVREHLWDTPVIYQWTIKVEE